MAKDDPFAYYFGKPDPDKKTIDSNSPKKTVKFAGNRKQSTGSYADDNEYSSEFQSSSEEDDKNSPNFWRKDEKFYKLPEHV